MGEHPTPRCYMSASESFNKKKMSMMALDANEVLEVLKKIVLLS